MAGSGFTRAYLCEIREREEARGRRDMTDHVAAPVIDHEEHAAAPIIDHGKHAAPPVIDDGKHAADYAIGH